MRPSTAFFYAILLFVSATYMLYFMLEFNGITRSDEQLNQQAAEEEEERTQILDREEHTDSLLSANDYKNGLVFKPAGSDVTAERTMETVAVSDRHSEPVDSYTVQGSDSTEKCLVGIAAAQTDIQMLDVYNVIPFDNPDGGAWKQGWQLSYDSLQWTSAEPLQVFIMPHSHNDPGWLKTFEEYYEESTKKIFDLMIQKLPITSKRKFIWAEISYLSLWWKTATDRSREIFKKLVKDGQVELVSGGWVMTDEANAHYSAMINQVVEGHEWIRNHIGSHALPKSGWSIDPFGLSPTMAYVLKLHKFDAMLIQRAHYSVKKHLGKAKALEFLWRQTWDKSAQTDILCHLMPFYSYDVPHTCGPEPKVCCQFDFARLPGAAKPLSCPWGLSPTPITSQNVQERAETLLDQYRKKAQLTQSNVILAPLGDDFRYDTEQEWERQFSNYEELIAYFHTRPDLNVRVQFGTLKEYFGALKKDTTDRAIALPTLSGDFFTYADRDDHYWSGYYTSRPFYKGLERRLEARLRSAEIAFSMAVARHQRNSTTSVFQSIDLLLGKLVLSRRSLALFQHHDGITGTAKTAVVADYAKKMVTALIGCDEVLDRSVAFLLSSDVSAPSSFSLESDEHFEAHDKPAVKKRLQVSAGNGRRVTLFNSLAQSREERVILRVNTAMVSVVEEASGEMIVSQINPVWMGKTADISVEEFEVVFLASVPALGIKSYLITPSPETPPINIRNSDRTATTKGLAITASIELFSESSRLLEGAAELFDIKSSTYPTEILLENDLFKLLLDGKTGYMKSMQPKSSNVSIEIAIKFIQYGTTSRSDKSGAYLFLPDGKAKDVLMEETLTETREGNSVHSKPLIRVIRGQVVTEVHLVLPQFIHVVRVTHSTGVEGQAPEIVNQVDISHTKNYELAMHLTTGIRNRYFVTDLNGFQLIRRKTLAKLPLQANYYPMPAVAFLEDDEYRVTLVSQQPLGVASLEEGTLEVMQDRRLDQDDNRGLGQPVHDNVPLTQSNFRLLLETNRPSVSKTIEKAQNHPVLSILSHLSLQSLLNPYVLLFDSTPLKTPASSEIRDYPGLSQDLPCDVHLINLRTAVAQESPEGVASAISENTATEGATALMLLHRVGVQCQRKTTINLKCENLKGKFNLKFPFETIFSLPYVEEGFSSALAVKPEVLSSVNASVTLNVMHIHALRFPLI